jgi:hypothetical protein
MIDFFTTIELIQGYTGPFTREALVAYLQKNNDLACQQFEAHHAAEIARAEHEAASHDALQMAKDMKDGTFVYKGEE